PGRGRRLTASPVQARAIERGVPVLSPEKAGDPDFLAALADLAPDTCAVVAYGALLPRAALDVPRIGWVNLHFSVLPAWRGAAPVQRAILAGDDMTGATTFLLEEGLDTGPVLGVVTEPIGPHDTAGDLLDRLASSGAQLLRQTMDGLAAGRLVAVPQPAEGVSHAAKLRPEDVRVDWSTPAMHIDRLVRAATPAPGAWTTFRDKRLKLGPVLLGDTPALAPGELRDLGPDGLRVGTATRPVVLTTVQPEGRGAMDASAWARGVRPAPGEPLR
ncbi:MAG: methionyl-tRNA formyltransferase, partial [Frankiaceae bacterium]|nr:methionyl-tRNA formyltransferase [Frankiaceae bacterium]